MEMLGFLNVSFLKDFQVWSLQVYYHLIGRRMREGTDKQLEIQNEKNCPQGQQGGSFIRQIITKEFIHNLKIQISQKVKPSKSILQALKHSSLINQSQKKTIDELSSKIQSLSTENRALKQRISQLQSAVIQKEQVNSSLLYSASLTRRQSERMLELKSKESLQAENQKSIDIQLLKERVQHLQEYKALKQTRFTEIIERQAQYVGQIDLLKYKNQSLSNAVKHLQETLHQVKSKQKQRTPIPNLQDQRLTRNKSEASQKFRSYINQQNSPDSKSDDGSGSLDEVRQIRHLIVPKENPSILVSCTKMVDIEQPYNIDAVEYVKRENRSFNEIDTILGEEVPKLGTKSNINSSEKEGMENMNESIVAINL